MQTPKKQYLFVGSKGHLKYLKRMKYLGAPMSEEAKRDKEELEQRTAVKFAFGFPPKS